MIEGVIANGVSFRNYSIKNFRMLSNIVAYTKECSLEIILIQLIQNPRSDFGYGAVVEG